MALHQRPWHDAVRLFIVSNKNWRRRRKHGECFTSFPKQTWHILKHQMSRESSPGTGKNRTHDKKTYTQRERSLKNRNYSIKSNFANNIFLHRCTPLCPPAYPHSPFPIVVSLCEMTIFRNIFLENKRLIFILTRKKGDPTIELKLFWWNHFFQLSLPPLNDKGGTHHWESKKSF